MGREVNGEFHARDSGPRRAAQLNELNRRVCVAEVEIDGLQEQVGGISPSGTPGDPGDLILWYENGKAGGIP